MEREKEDLVEKPLVAFAAPPTYSIAPALGPKGEDEEEEKEREGGGVGRTGSKDRLGGDGGRILVSSAASFHKRQQQWEEKQSQQ